MEITALSTKSQNSEVMDKRATLLCQETMVVFQTFYSLSVFFFYIAEKNLFLSCMDVWF